MNAAPFLAHATGQPHAHGHDLAATVVILLLAVAFTFLLRRAR